MIGIASCIKPLLIFRRKFLYKKDLKASKNGVKALLYAINIIQIEIKGCDLSDLDYALSRDISQEIIINNNYDILEKYSQDREYYKEIIISIKNSSELMSLISLIYRVFQYPYHDISRIEFEKFEKWALIANSTSSRIESRKDLKKAHYKFLCYKNKFYSNKKDLQAIKISLSISDFLKIVTILGTVFLVTGYIENYLFFRSYNLDISSFFNTQDYLTINIESIASILITTVFYVVSAYLGANSSVGYSPSELEDDFLYKEKVRKRLLIFFIVLSLLCYFVTYVHLLFIPLFVQLLIYSIFYLLFSIKFIPFIAKRFFIDSLKTRFILLFIFVYVGCFTYQYMFNSISVIKKENIVWKFNPKRENIRIIRLNSHYVFAKDTLTKELVIFPIKDFKEMRILSEDN